jgi:hypothetical protein
MHSIACARVKASSTALFRRDLFGTQIKFLLPAFSTRGLSPVSTAAMSNDSAKAQVAASFQSRRDQQAFKDNFKLVSGPELLDQPVCHNCRQHTHLLIKGVWSVVCGLSISSSYPVYSIS